MSFFSTFPDKTFVCQVRAERVESVEQQDNKAPSVKEIASLFSVKGSSSTSSVDQTKMVRTQRKSVAPKFVTPLVGVIVEQNARVMMEAIMDGRDPFLMPFR
jgi:hypothetical protein